MKNRSTWLFILFVFILPASTYALVNWFSKNHSRLPQLGSFENKFEFRNQVNKVVTEKSWDDKIVIADFFFTYCGTICPKMTYNMKKVASAFKHDPGIILTSFTVDPDRDSPERLNEYVQQVKIPTINWDLLTGSKQELYKLARNGLKIVATDGDGGPEDFIHSSRFVLIDKNKKIRGYYDGTDESEVKKLISDIKKLLKE